MTSIGDSLGRGGFERLGVGYSAPPLGSPVQASVPYNKFSGGFDASELPEETPSDRAVYAVDMEISNESALIRSPGIVQVQEVTGRDLSWIFEQFSLDFTAELVVIDPPYVCVKTSGTMACTDKSIGATGSRGWHAISVAGTLIFSNRADKCYTREFGTGVIADISTEIVADTFAQIFGRVFAGGVKVGGGSYQALGIAWNAASGDLDDWTGLGSGAELLIQDQGDADKVMALRGVGFDTLAICNRYSLWAGYPTGDSERPADFRPRVQSVGIVAGATAVVTPIGVLGLSDDGVLVFDLNSARIISKEINAYLLPIDYSQLLKYSAIYQAEHNRYILRTPYDIWIYELPKAGENGRWLHRSAVVSGMAHFADQSGEVQWGEVVGTWADMTRQWDEMDQYQPDAPGRLVFTSGALLGQEDEATSSNFGTALTPVWRTPAAVKEVVTGQYTTLGFELVYSSLEPAAISIRLTDSSGTLAGTLISKTLPTTNGAVVRKLFHKIATGMNVMLEIAITSGSPKIMRLRQVVQEAGPSLESLP